MRPFHLPGPISTNEKYVSNFALTRRDACSLSVSQKQSPPLLHARPVAWTSIALQSACIGKGGTLVGADHLQTGGMTGGGRRPASTHAGPSTSGASARHRPAALTAAAHHRALWEWQSTCLDPDSGLHLWCDQAWWPCTRSPPLIERR